MFVQRGQVLGMTCLYSWDRYLVCHVCTAGTSTWYDMFVQLGQVLGMSCLYSWDKFLVCHAE